MDKTIREILCALSAHSVEHLVVDGYGVGGYTEPRTTKDRLHVENIREADSML